MSARPIGDIIRPIVEQAERLSMFQYLLALMPNDGARKRLITDWYERGLLDEDQAAILITAHMLEAA